MDAYVEVFIAKVQESGGASTAPKKPERAVTINVADSCAGRESV